MKTIKVEIYKNTAFCVELAVASTGDNQEDAIHKLMKKIREMSAEQVVFSLPYLGRSFSMKWEEIKKPKPPELDEFEQAQKLHNRLQKDVA